MANGHNRRPSVRHSLSEHIAAEQLACEILVGTPGLMEMIARAARAPLRATTGPAFDAIASLLLSGDDPAENIGLIVDAVARELRPRGPTIDPQSVEIHGGAMHPMDILKAMFYDAPVVTGAGADGDVPPLEQQPASAQAAREAAAAIAKLLDRGQNHRDKDHRQKEKAAAAREAGQLWFCGLDWRLPPSNDDDDGLDGDGLAPQGA